MGFIRYDENICLLKLCHPVFLNGITALLDETYHKMNCCVGVSLLESSKESKSDYNGFAGTWSRRLSTHALATTQEVNVFFKPYNVRTEAWQWAIMFMNTWFIWSGYQITYQKGIAASDSYRREFDPVIIAASKSWRRDCILTTCSIIWYPSDYLHKVLQYPIHHS